MNNSMGFNQGVACVTPPASRHDCRTIMHVPEFSSFETCDVVSLLVDNVEFPDLPTKNVGAAKAPEAAERKNVAEPMAVEQVPSVGVAEKIASIAAAAPPAAKLAANGAASKKTTKPPRSKNRPSTSKQNGVAKTAAKRAKKTAKGDGGKRRSGAAETETPTRPRRPLSGYNLFFKYERTRLLRLAERGEPFADVPPTLAEASDIRELMRKDSPYHVDHSKRRHRKSHGKVSFGDLFKIVLKNWQQLTPQMRAPFDEVAADLKASYEKEAKGYKVWKRREQWRKTKARSRKKQQEEQKAQKASEAAGEKAPVPIVAPVPAVPWAANNSTGDEFLSAPHGTEILATESFHPSMFATAKELERVQSASCATGENLPLRTVTSGPVVPYPVHSNSDEILSMPLNNHETLAADNFTPSIFDDSSMNFEPHPYTEWEAYQNNEHPLTFRGCEEDLRIML